jgi:hypothetical protein
VSDSRPEVSRDFAVQIVERPRVTTAPPAGPREVPRRIHTRSVAIRYGISTRLAEDWIARTVRDGAAVKVGRWTMARPSELDAWVMAGAGHEHGRRRP